MLAVIVPTCGHWDYAQLAIESAARTPNCAVIVVDDASEKWPGPGPVLGWIAREGSMGLVHQFRNRGGLSRSWSYGLRAAQRLGCEHAVCGNSDLVFARGWWPPLEECLEAFDFAGPITNAPGHHGVQDVSRYVEGYVLSDDPDDIDDVQQRLPRRAPIQRGALNGYCIAGRVSSWFRAAHDARNVFDPAIPLAGNEDDLFHRARSRGMTCAVCPRSYVLHYRSVTRGLRGSPIERGAIRIKTCAACE